MVLKNTMHQKLVGCSQSGALREIYSFKYLHQKEGINSKNIEEKIQ